MGEYDDSELRERIIAERQVEAFLSILKSRYGLSEQELPDIIENLKWISTHKQSLDKIGGYAVLTLVGLIITAGAVLLWEGLKHMVQGR